MTDVRAEPTEPTDEQPSVEPARASRAAIAIGLSRATGVVRTTLTTNFLGIGAVGDAFAAAMRIPNMLVNLLGEGTLNAAFVPTYSAASGQDRQVAGRLAGAIATFLLAITAATVLIGVFAARPLTRLIAWGFVDERFELTVKLLRITVIGSGLAVLSAWCVAVLVSQRRLFIAYVAPVLWNATQIGVLVGVGLAGFNLTSRATALAWAVTAGAVAQLLLLALAVRRAEPALKLNWRWRGTSERVVLRRLGPAVLGRGALQLSAFVDLALASLLAVGATAAIAAAQAVFLVPVALIGVAVAAADLPAMSRLTTADEIYERLGKRLLDTSYLVMGVVALYLASSIALADVLFNFGGLRDAIARDDVLLIGLALAAYTVGLPAVVASRLCQNVLFVYGEVRYVTIAAVVRVTVSAAFGLLLMFPFDRLAVVAGTVTGHGFAHEALFAPLPDAVRLDPDLPARLGAVGLAIGATIGAFIELYLIRRRILKRWRVGLLTGLADRLSLDHHTFPGTIAFAVGFATNWLLVEFVGSLTSLVRLLIVSTVVMGAHLGMGLAFKLPIARAVVLLPRAILNVVRRRRSSGANG